MQTVAGLFRRFEDAERAYDSLRDSGFEKEEISVLARDRAVGKRIERDRSASEVAGSAGIGALGGGVLGGLAGLLASLGALTIPGLGPAFVAGSLASTLGLTTGGASIGAAVGGILGAMTALSIPEEEAQVYAEGVKRGGILVSVQAEGERANLARTLMANSNALDIESLRKTWNKEGWERFDESQAPDQNARMFWDRSQDEI